jgi:hypothetical protein
VAGPSNGRGADRPSMRARILPGRGEEILAAMGAGAVDLDNH